VLSLNSPGIQAEPEAAVGLFWLSRLDDHSGYVTGVLGPIMVIAVGLGLTFVLSS
jgi:hypothetical protein